MLYFNIGLIIGVLVGISVGVLLSLVAIVSGALCSRKGITPDYIADKVFKEKGDVYIPSDKPTAEDIVSVMASTRPQDLKVPDWTGGSWWR